MSVGATLFSDGLHMGPLTIQAAITNLEKQIQDGKLGEAEAVMKRGEFALGYIGQSLTRLKTIYSVEQAKVIADRNFTHLLSQYPDYLLGMKVYAEKHKLPLILAKCLDVEQSLSTIKKPNTNAKS